jgi:hypothetical protein
MFPVHYCSQVREVFKPEAEPVLVQQSHETFELPASKRQKINGKQNPPPTYQQNPNQKNYGEFLQSMLHHAPKVGKRSFLSGDAIEKAQQVFPNMQIKALEVCKGADRCRMPCEGGDPKECNPPSPNRSLSRRRLGKLDITNS